MDRIEALIAFTAAAEHESFTVAAAKLGKTRASITRGIAELEQDLRTQLFHRNTRSVALTDEGLEYVVRARELLKANAAFEEGPTVQNEPSGKLLVTIPVSFGRHHVMPLVSDYLDKYPKVDAQIILTDKVVSLSEESFDVGVRLGILRDGSLESITAGSLRLAIYASPSYIAQYGEPLMPDELLQHRTISSNSYNPNSDRWAIKGTEGRQYASVKPRLILTSTEEAAATAASGHGIVSLLSYQAEAFVKSGELVEILSSFAIDDIPINIVRPKDVPVSAKVSSFVSEIATGLRRHFGA